MEKSPAAKDAMAQILTNSRMSATGHRPICQDTGIVNVFLKVGMDVRFEGFDGKSLDEIINEGVRRGYNDPENRLRASIVADPLFARKNTGDNTPAVIHTELVPGNKLDITVAAKGGGSENKSKLAMLNPSDSLVDWVLKTVPTMGAGWCPPGMLGIGIGGTAERAVLLANGRPVEPCHFLLENEDWPLFEEEAPQSTALVEEAHANALAASAAVQDVDAPRSGEYAPATGVSAGDNRMQGAVIPLHEMERIMILKGLEVTSGNRTQAADLLGISVRTLRNKLNEYRAAGHPID